ncbi:MAG: hypothetical protein U0T83_02505 [Bacteriovoracaceae bacterium]
MNNIDKTTQQNITAFQNRKQMIEKICLEFNPYLDTIAPHIKVQLIALGFDLENYDPFKITNQLLKMLDELSEKIEEEKAPLRQ